MKTSYDTSNLTAIPNAKIAIIQSQRHHDYTDVCVRRCTQVLQEAGCTHIEQHQLPGAYELPLAAQHLTQQQWPYDAIIAFGALIQGQTYHFQMIVDTIIQWFARVMLDTSTPIINEVLAVTDESHLAARCADNNGNKGIEAALAAIDMITRQQTINKK